ncbi:MAG: hypothetical protein JWQ35_1611 [Bacteriovoracaceae bacterium]|nr:hypothetical protein [Bacteriovoracaceae bacterium]
MSFWIPSRKQIGRLDTVEHELTNEVSLVGKHGEIWQFDDNGNYRVLITDFRIANKLSKKLNARAGYRKDDEAVLKFKDSDLQIIVEAIEVFQTQDRQVVKASNFGLPEGRPPEFRSKNRFSKSRPTQSTNSTKKIKNSPKKANVKSQSDANPKAGQSSEGI